MVEKQEIDDRLEAISEQLAQLVRTVAAFRAETNRRFEQIDERFEQIDQRLEQMDQRLQQNQREHKQMESRLGKLTETVSALSQKIDEQAKFIGKQLGSWRLEIFGEMYDVQQSINQRYQQLESRGSRLEDQVAALVEPKG